jgi:hypothetical protein
MMHINGLLKGAEMQEQPVAEAANNAGAKFAAIVGRRMSDFGATARIKSVLDPKGFPAPGKQGVWPVTEGAK